MKRRVLILGGGIAGLTAAYELSRTAELRDRWEVEVLEMGHRFGGRLASGHDPEHWGRNVEHGLHVWFGIYDNTFRLAEDLWSQGRLPKGCPWGSVWDGLRPIFHSDHGLVAQEQMVIRRAFLPRAAGLPGAEDPRFLDALFAILLDAPRALTATARSILADELAPAPSSAVRRASLAQLGWLSDRMIGALPSAASDDRVRVAHRLERVLARFHRPLARLAMRIAGSEPGRLAVAHALDMGLSLLRGLCSIEHRLMADGDLDRLTAWELSDWLSYHGLSERSRRDSRLLLALYDIPLALRDGRPDAPVMEAGTALRYTLRLLLGYKHAPAYLLSAGAGETLVAPLCALLQERGVRLTPFHRLERLQLDGAGRRVEAVELSRCARAGEDFPVVVERGGFWSTPYAPDWSRIEGGRAMAEAGVDFYSRFDRPEGEQMRWQRGERFDDVVLALPLGAVAPDADGHSPVADWLRHHPPAARCLERLHLVPTVAAQLWLDRCAPALEDRAVVTWAQPYSVACDMSPVIAHERWPAPGPKACVYLCGPAPLKAHRRPRQDRQAPARDVAEARRVLARQLDEHGASLLGEGWSLHGAGEDDPLDAQYVRANVQPWDLADLPLPGADAVRLEATDSGLSNLALAGTWVRTPINTTSVEAAVCSGIAAARALGASTQPILNESLLRRPSPRPCLNRDDHHDFDRTDLRTAI